MSMLRQQFVMGKTEATSYLLNGDYGSEESHWKRSTQNFGPTPLFDSEMPLRSIAKVKAGYNYTMFITTDGDLWGVGTNVCGQLFTSHVAQKPVKCVIPEISKNCFKVACGFDHTIVVLKNGQAWGYGSNSCGQLGGKRGKLQITDELNIEPRLVSCAATGQHSAFLTDEGLVYASGWNHFGQTNPYNRTSTDAFELVKGLPIARKVKAGYYLTAVITYDHNVHICGGDNSTFKPLMIQHPQLINNVKKISCGQSHIVFLTLDNDVYMKESFNEDSSDPIKIELLQLNLFGQVRSIYSGYAQVCLVTNKNEVLVFGTNRYAQIDPDSKEEEIKQPKLLNVDVLRSSRLQIKASLNCCHTVIYTVPASDLLSIQQELHLSCERRQLTDVHICQ